MNINPIDQYDDIQKIQSFIIIITSPSKQPHPESENQKSKILPQRVLEDLEDKLQRQTDNNILEKSLKNGGTSIAGLTLKKIQYKTKLHQNVQRYAQMKEKCEILINYSPYKARHASTGCLRKAQQTKKSHLKISDFHKPNRAQQMRVNHERNMIPFQQRSFINLPQLKINPFQLTLACNNVLQKFYLFKTLKSAQKYSLYLAQNDKNKAIYTLKIIKKCQVRKQQLQKLIKQLKIQGYLNHVNLVKLLYITHDRHFLYIFYQPSMMEHQNLGEQIKEGGPLFQRQVRRIIKQICSAVQYLQKNNIVHQNIRPESIYCQQGIVKLGNFNKSEHISYGLSSKSKSQQNFKWLIPQSVFTDSKADIWSIGFLTYELLFGRPFIVVQQGLNRNKITKKSLYFSQEVDVSNTAKEFIQECLQKNHAKRLSIKGAIEHGFLKGGDKYRWTTV